MSNSNDKKATQDSLESELLAALDNWALTHLGMTSGWLDRDLAHLLPAIRTQYARLIERHEAMLVK